MIDETTLIGVVRADVSFARDNGEQVEREVNVALAVADLLELPDDCKFIPATEAAIEYLIQIIDPGDLPRMRAIALAAGLRPPT